MQKRFAMAGIQIGQYCSDITSSYSGFRTNSRFSVSRYNNADTKDDVKAFEGVVRNFVTELNKRKEIANSFSFSLHMRPVITL